MPKHIHQMANTVCCKQKYGNLNAWACSTFFCTSVSAVPSCYENKNPITSTEEVQSCPKSELQVIIIIIIHPKENTDRKNIHDVDRWMVYQESTKENTARKKIHTVDRWMVYQERSPLPLALLSYYSLSLFSVLIAWNQNGNNIPWK